MLVVTRKIHKDDPKKGRRIFIGNNIIVTLISVDRNSVRIGIEAPEGVVVLREELMSEGKVAAIERAAKE